jgi:hypothetical protein
MPLLNRQEWLEKNGFRHGRDPFGLGSICAEDDKLLFLEEDFPFLIEPPFYEEIRGNDTDIGPRFIFAAKGGGKTTIKELILRDLNRSLDINGSKEKTLAVVYDDFDLTVSRAKYYKDNLIPRHHVEQIITLILERLLEILGQKAHSGRLSCLHDKKIQKLLTRYVKDFGSFHPLQRERLIKSVRGLRRKVDWEQNIGLLITLANLLNDALSPPLLQKMVMFIASVVSSRKDEHIADIISSYKLLEDITAICRHFGFERLYILMDNVDDVYFMDTDDSSKASYYLVRSLATYTKMLRIPGLVLKFFLPEKIYLECQKVIHLDSLGARVLSWDRDACERIYQQRLAACWDDGEELRNKYGLSKLCDRELGLIIDDEIVKFGELMKSPRAIILLGNELLAEHFRFGFREKSDKITMETWNRARQRAEEVLA